MKIRVNKEKFDTLLAALRLWQFYQDNDQSMIPSAILAIADEHSHILHSLAIDELCERLNMRKKVTK